ncbi:MAG: carcinine hydrolase/isopenicillin-N N-acyltransferase family protein [Formivibrio sp.]|nr:carcinine hydrolase/isopenicillin-N N-acyltransferase family protein [Formivibrio sp.]
MAKYILLRLLATTLALALYSAPVAASTIWAAAGDDANGGTLLAKNRDGKSDHRQILIHSKPGEGFSWFGLYSTGKEDPGLNAGVNEKGLSIVSTAASSIPAKQRVRQPGKHSVISQILSRFASVDELAANADHVFSGSRAVSLLVADHQQVLMAEIGLGGEFVFHTVDKGTLAHTNHYLNKDLAVFNTAPNPGSLVRLARINVLLKKTASPYTLSEFIAMSRDRHDGPENSLWRTGKERTLSSWIIQTPASGAAKLRVVIANPRESEKTFTYTLNDIFWKSLSGNPQTK